jgi:hypothetical protein
VSQFRCIGADQKVVSGDPDPKHVSTSYVERHNLTMRMGMRRFTRLTNGFSKKIENHIAMVAIHAVYYNFARIHKTLRITPSMAAGLSDHVWSLEEIVMMADSYAPAPAKRGPYKSLRVIAHMGKIPLGWSIMGTVMGAIGFAYNLILLGAIINGVDVGRRWVILGAVFCPRFIPLRNVWCVLALNCILYATLFGGLRFVWIKIRRPR